MKGPFLFILCGLPFSGKTTLAKELVKRFEFERVDIDEIKKEFGLGEKTNHEVSNTDWDTIYSESYKKVRVALQLGKIVIDDTANFTDELRKKLRTKTGNFPFRVIYINTPVEVAKKRMEENRKSNARFNIPDEDFYEVADQLEIPTDENTTELDYRQSIDTWIENLRLP